MFARMERTSEILKALSDPTRLRIISLLRHGELCVCDLTAALQIPQSTVSRHLSSLKNAGWVHGLRCGKWMHYRLRDDQSALHNGLIELLKTQLPAHETCARDDQRYLSYLATKPSQACD